MHREGKSYSYPPTVIGTIGQEERSEYIQAARRINALHPDVVFVEHEFGIYGGAGGAYILDVLRFVESPVVCVVHTYPFQRGGAKQRLQAHVLHAIASLSDVLITISEAAQTKLAAELLSMGIQTPVLHIPHGTPDVEDFLLDDPKQHVDGTLGKLALTTFGLIGPRKGIDDVIDVLPRVIQHYPNVQYRVLGSPHPADQEAQRYVRRLKRDVRRRGLDGHIYFATRFLSVREIMRNLQATDVYVTFYDDPNQASSGTLAYALAAGCCIVSTPYVHARELLDGGRGILVPFSDRDALASTLIDILGDKRRREEYKRRAFSYGQTTAWKRIGRMYVAMLRVAAQRTPASILPTEAVRRRLARSSLSPLSSTPTTVPTEDI